MYIEIGLVNKYQNKHGTRILGNYSFAWHFILNIIEICTASSRCHNFVLQFSLHLQATSHLSPLKLNMEPYLNFTTLDIKEVCEQLCHYYVVSVVVSIILCDAKCLLFTVYVFLFLIRVQYQCSGYLRHQDLSTLWQTQRPHWQHTAILSHRHHSDSRW